MEELARDTAGIELSWGLWAMAGIVPVLLSMVVLPYVLYKLYPPEIRRTPEAQTLAREKLAEMGAAPIYFGAGYVTQGQWWKLGFLCSVINIIIWIGIGSLWWKMLGIW